MQEIVHDGLLNGLIFLPKIAETAYLDPGSGSFILQIIIASLAALGYTFRSQITKLGNFFRRKDDDKEK